jgi:hypothetical protein
MISVRMPLIFGTLEPVPTQMPPETHLPSLSINTPKISLLTTTLDAAPPTFTESVLWLNPLTTITAANSTKSCFVL